ncbi:methyltransferase domain-containing protein [Listeria grandensis]|uniref:Methyltransferase domain-containing protein n=1 Tax=Listeria grandensis TaxID=1494963 RepID=A0A7X0Y399_9LIST|nr:methyltransferase domain-containing protein [Listeria grandensis]MBC1935928.1 methyltransferase domain-containing protein [Listeria grandensis]
MEDNIFENIAKKYDNPQRIELANIIANRVKEELADAGDKTLIDYGSGTGLVGLQLAGLVASATLIDAAENMVAIINEKLASHPLQNVSALVSDFTADTIPVKADIILVSLVLLHIPDTKIILEQLYKTLNENGKLIIVDFDKNPQISHPKVHNGFVAAELEELLAQTGFNNATIEVFHHGNNLFMNQDAALFIATSSK